MAQEHALDGGVVGPGIEPDGLGDILALDQRERLFKAEHMSAVRLAPAGRGYDRGFRGKREQREALEGAGRLPEEIDGNPVLRTGVLIEYEDDDGAGREQVQDGVKRAA